ncbi:MAG: hypothetical protein ABI707_08225 [Ferruginibacter sp.]
MKKLIIILLLPLQLFSATIYVSTTGNDVTGTGVIGNPYASLYKASTIAKKAGDIIYINRGTYTVASSVSISSGVSVQGADSSNTILNSTVSGRYIATINFSSRSLTNGNQSVSGLKIDGGLTTYAAIWSSKRNNMNIHGCTFKNMGSYGVIFDNTASGVYSTGNEVYNNQFQNCAGDFFTGRNHFAYGALAISKQSGMRIHGNLINEDLGRKGYGIKFSQNGDNRGLKIYSNTIITAKNIDLPGISSWSFGIELWYENGLEIYKNRVHGSVDINTVTKGAYAFGADIYDNIIGRDVLGATVETGITLEGKWDDVHIRNNQVKNVSVGMTINKTLSDTMRNLYIYRNTFTNLGIVEKTRKYACWGIRFTSSCFTNVVDNVQILNNVFSANLSCTRMWGIQLPNQGHSTNVIVRNNIIQGFRWPIYCSTDAGSGVTIDTLSVENNIYYNNYLANAIEYTNLAPRHSIIQNNSITNPLFVSASEYRLQSRSAARNAGLNVGLPYKGASPDIGAFDFDPPASVNGNRIRIKPRYNKRLPISIPHKRVKP